MAKFDFDGHQATKEWLTDMLIRNGYIEVGGVAEVVQQKAELGAGGSGALYSLKLSYTPNSSGNCPSRLLMKVTKSGSAGAFEDRTKRFAAWLLVPQSQRHATLLKEPIFYESVRTSSSTLPLITCYGSEIDAEHYNACILLEDLSDSHTQPPWPIHPDARHCEQTIEALANLHGHWWESEKFGSADFPIASAEEIEESVDIYRRAYSQFSLLLGDRLNEERRAVFEYSLTQLPRLLKSRMANTKNLTLAHGDAHHWNTLLPKSAEDVVIFDWQTWHIDSGAHDLAYLMGALWFPEHRARQEKVLLKKYLDTLNALGIQYTWDELMSDYRLSVIRHLFTPVIFSSFIMPAVWWPQLDRVFSTYDDWNCDEMWD